MMHICCCCDLIRLSTCAQKKDKEINFACAIYWFVRNVEFMDDESEYHFNHVNPEKCKVNCVNDKFCFICLALPVYKNIERANYNNNVI